MKIEVENNELVFQKKDSEEWFSKIYFSKYELYFSFQETIFMTQVSNEIIIDWKLIEAFIKHALNNIDKINSKGSEAIEGFEKIVQSENTLYQKEKGDFEIDSFNLIDFTKTVENDKSDNEFIQYRFKYDVEFFYETESGFNQSTDYTYKVQFSNHHSLTIIGVSNDIWSLYK